MNLFILIFFLLLIHWFRCSFHKHLLGTIMYQTVYWSGDTDCVGAESIEINQFLSSGSGQWGRWTQKQKIWSEWFLKSLKERRDTVLWWHWGMERCKKWWLGFSGGAVIKTLYFQGKEPRSDLWSGSYIPHASVKIPHTAAKIPHATAKTQSSQTN